MVQLDARLLFDARRLMDGANAYLLKEMILAYEQAVHLHNSGRGNHKWYHPGPELKLRAYIMKERLNELTRQPVVFLDQVRAVMAETSALRLQRIELDLGDF